MNVNVSMSRSALAGSAALMMLVATGCSRVKPEELSAQLAALRAEMRNEYQQGDQRVTSELGGRIAGLLNIQNGLISRATRRSRPTWAAASTRWTRGWTRWPTSSVG